MQFVISGFTGSGKTTLARALGEQLGTSPCRTSDFLIQELRETRPKSERILAWKDREGEILTNAEIRAGMEADKRHRALINELGHDGVGVHESLVLGTLLRPSKQLCRVFLHVEPCVRFERIAREHNLSAEVARRTVSRKGAQSQKYMQAAYQTKLGSHSYLEHFEVIVSTLEGEQFICSHYAPIVALQMLLEALSTVADAARS